MWAKALFTIVGIMALLRHPIPCPKDAVACESLPVFTTILQYVEQVDGNTFFMFAALAMSIKFVGVLASAYAWHLLLRAVSAELNSLLLLLAVRVRLQNLVLHVAVLNSLLLHFT